MLPPAVATHAAVHGELVSAGVLRQSSGGVGVKRSTSAEVGLRDQQFNGHKEKSRLALVPVGLSANPSCQVWDYNRSAEMRDTEGGASKRSVLEQAEKLKRYLAAEGLS